MTKERTREQQIAEAFLLISKADHYMVGFVHPYSSYDDLEGAKETLITIANAFGGTNEVAERALDLIEHEIKVRQRKALDEEMMALKMTGEALISKDEFMKQWTWEPKKDE